MRKFQFIVVIVIVFVVGALTVFTSTSSISFIGKDKESGIDVALDSVYVLNKTQSLDTTLIQTTSFDLGIFTGLEENDHANQVGFSISQNYPNAFECQTQFTVYLPKRGNLSVSVFNLVGQKILTSANQYSAGFHSFSLEGANLSNGIYIISARNGEETKSIKIIKLGTRSGQETFIKYQGQAVSENNSLSKKSIFNPGDTYLFVGYANGYSRDTLDNQVPTGLENYEFELVTIYGQFTDPRDGKVYKTITIGTQIWLAENLNVSVFRNGDPIPEVKDSVGWIKAGEDGTPAWCFYKNDSANGELYGKLYNWYVVNDPRGLAPEGWHVPSKEEFDIVVAYCGGAGINAYTSLKIGGSSGFSSLFGGCRGDGGDFRWLGITADYWSASEYNDDAAWRLYLNGNSKDANMNYYLLKKCGFSVRCLMISIPSVPSAPTCTATSNTSITVKWNAVSGATFYNLYQSTSSTGTYTEVSSNSTDTSYTDTGLSPNTTYYYKLQACNTMGCSNYSSEGSATTTQSIPSVPSAPICTATSNTSIRINWNAVSGATSYKVYRATSLLALNYLEISSRTTVTSYNDTGLTENTTYYYKLKACNSAGCSNYSSIGSAKTISLTVKIGTQTWMVMNLNVSVFRNGDLIPEVKDSAGWVKAGEDGTPAWCYYGNDRANGELYGKLYNWYAINDLRGLVPKGWHVPSKEEFDTLLTNCGGANTLATYHALIPGGSSGFNLLLGGGRINNGVFIDLDTVSAFWSSSQKDDATAWLMHITSSAEDADLHSLNKGLGCSVRCIED